MYNSKRYPKSGTTWVEEIVWLLVNNLDYEQSKQRSHFYDRITFIDEGVSEVQMAELTSPRVLKTHFTPRFLPDDFNSKTKATISLFNIDGKKCNHIPSNFY